MDASPHEDKTPEPAPHEEELAMSDALDEDEASAGVMHLRREGVPLALLADLADPHGPSSPTILQDEGLPDVAWWGADGAPSDAGDDAEDADQDEDAEEV